MKRSDRQRSGRTARGAGARGERLVNIITRTSHYENFTMKGMGFILNGRPEVQVGAANASSFLALEFPAIAPAWRSEVRKTPSWP